MPWLVSMFSVTVTACVIPACTLSAQGPFSRLEVAAIAVLVLGIANLIVRPIVVVLAGEQTDGFIYHRSDLTVAATRNAVDVFPILNGRRGIPTA